MAISKFFPDCFYRVTIKGVHVKDGKVLLMRESEEYGKGVYELPGGGLDFGENIQDGFKREIKEEMGLTVSKMSEKPVYIWTYKFENKRGMDWYYVLVLAYQIEFENLNFTPSGECEAIGFYAKEELKKLILNGQIMPFADMFDPRDFDAEF